MIRNAAKGDEQNGGKRRQDDNALGIHEAPAAMTLIAAHRALEDIVLTKAELSVKRGIEDTWARTVYDGLWFSPVREALDAFVAKTQELAAIIQGGHLQ